MTFKFYRPAATAATCVLLAAGLAPVSALAQVSVNINVPGIVTVAPPPPRYEVVPQPRSGQIWVQGYWAWDHNDYRWRPGYWQPARPDYDYVPGRWVRADGGYRWTEGSWKGKGKGKGGPPGYHCPPGQAKKGHC
ncbi:YXWGXW repeat-containing protein [Variovorax sp.]|uniref:YXWGXW repeat-containing protein n=1 Tax=Variovorax sp. TaxID=1871043 RepID=UPI002D572586|nr:YXWGXW repeat-containing protein [Variovorax sp.]HYP86154.1 YXWGXW repeat-containing protein [Variovorax sp.]